MVTTSGEGIALAAKSGGRAGRVRPPGPRECSRRDDAESAAAAAAGLKRDDALLAEIWVPDVSQQDRSRRSVRHLDTADILFFGRGCWRRRIRRSGLDRVGEQRA